MNACNKCGKPSSSDQCPDCRYRAGGKLHEEEPHERDLVELMVRHSHGFFTADQLDQITPQER